MEALGLQSVGALFSKMNLGQKLGIGALLVKEVSILKEKPKTTLSLAAVGTAIAAIAPPFNGLMLGVAAGLEVVSALIPPDGHKDIMEYVNAVRQFREESDKHIIDLTQKNKKLSETLNQANANIENLQKQYEELKSTK